MFNARRLSVLAGVVVLVIVGYIFGLRFEHTQSGYKTALGAADSGIALVIKESKYSQNDKVVTGIGKAGKSPAIGFVASSKDPNYLIKLPTAAVAVKKSDISGKLVAVVPFIGYLFKVVGL